MPALAPRRFRTRLLVVMLTVGLLPLAGWGLASHVLTTRILALRPTPLEELLSRVDERLGSSPTEQALRGDLAAARLNLLQVELARRSLARLMPRLLVGTLLASAALLALTAFGIGRQLARPLELVAAGMARYARGDLAHRLPEARGPDELRLLVAQFNRMGDELAAQRARLEVSEAIAAWQGVARALAHELKNPLTAMRLSLARLRRSPAANPLEPVNVPAAAPAPEAPESDAARRTEALDLVERQIDTLLRLAQSFSSFARLPAPELRPAALRPIVEEACALYRSVSSVPVTCAAVDVEASVDPALLGRALGNLVKNAVEASRAGGGPVEVRMGLEQERVLIQVLDRGCGIPGALEGAALARSLGSTKAEGSGLGLPIAHRIVHEHGGSLCLAPRDGGGTQAVVLLPRPAEAR